MALALLQYRNGASFRAQDYGLWGEVSMARVIKSRDGINSLALGRCVCNLESVTLYED